MATDLDIAKIVYGGSGLMTAAGWASSRQGGAGQTNMGTGTVVAVNQDGTVTIKLDNSGELITVVTDTPLAVGDRVVVVSQNGKLLVYAAAGFNRNLASAKNELGEQIKEQGKQIEDKVLPQFEQFKKDHQLTDADIKSEISTSGNALKADIEGKIEADGAQYTKKTDFEATIDGVNSKVTELYDRTNTLDMTTVDLQSQIDQQSGTIKSEVMQSVTDEVGKTYATKTELQQTSKELSVTVQGAVTEAKTKWGTCSTSAGTSAKVVSCPGFTLYQGAMVVVRFTYANTASGVTLDVNGTGPRAATWGDSSISPYTGWSAGATVAFSYDGTYWRATDNPAIASNMTFDTSGLTISASNSSYKTRYSSSGFAILDEAGSTAIQFGMQSSTYCLIEGRADILKLMLNGTTSCLVVNADDDSVDFSADYGRALRRTGTLGYTGDGTYNAFFLLWSNSSGTYGSLQLAYDAANFNYLVFCCEDYINSRFSAWVTARDSYFSADLSAAYVQRSSGVHVESRTVIVSGTSVTDAYDTSGWFSMRIGGTEPQVNSGHDSIKITAVYGVSN